MIKNYLLERLSWILFFVFLHIFIIFIAYLDSAIPLLPILYLSSLSLIMFIFFVIIRYWKETRYYKSLAAWEENLDLTSLTAARSPFEKIIEQRLNKQTAALKQEVSHNMLILEQEKDQLLSWIHEVKTPLTALHLIIERLEDRKIKAQLTYEWLRIHLLLDRQLHQKRIPSLENDLYIEQIDLASLLFQEIKTLQSWCLQKGIGFDIQLDVKEVLSDAKWLAFIIRQLLTNAVKYSGASDINMISYQQEGQTKLDIRDAGRGIDSRDIPRLFDKGFTSTTHHQDQAATGMGLYLVKQVAQPLSIDVAVHSTVGKGTTFTLTFPKKNNFDRVTGM